MFFDPQNGSDYNLRSMIYVDGHHRVRLRSEQYLGQPVEQALIGRPVIFSEDPAENWLAEEKLRRRGAGSTARRVARGRANQINGGS